MLPNRAVINAYVKTIMASNGIIKESTDEKPNDGFSLGLNDVKDKDSQALKQAYSDMISGDGDKLEPTVEDYKSLISDIKLSCVVSDDVDAEAVCKLLKDKLTAFDEKFAPKKEDEKPDDKKPEESK